MVDLKRYRKEVFNFKDDNLSGCTGKCFIEGNQVVKIYYSPRVKDEVTDLTTYRSPRISFPLEYVKKRRYYYGEVMPYFPYKNLLEGINKDTQLEKLINDYNVIVDEIKRFPDLIMNDISWPNILYDNNQGFYLIDISNWEEAEIFNHGKFLEYNIGDLNDSIIYCLWKKCTSLDYDDYWIKKYLGKSFYEAYICSIRGTYEFSKLLSICCEITQNYYNCDIKSIDDLQKSAKILKKS